MPDGSPPACFTAAASCEHSCFSASVACGGRLGGGKEGVPPPLDAWTPTRTCARMLLPPRVLPPLPLAPTAPVVPPETPMVVVVVDELDVRRDVIRGMVGVRVGDDQRTVVRLVAVALVLSEGLAARGQRVL